MPGDKLGIIEQYLLGKGTYEDNGEIKSSVLGNVQIDSKMRTITVKAKSGQPALLKVGDAVYGQITDIKEEIVTVYIRNFQTYIPFEKYLTEEYYYGDYTKMNTYLVNRYHIPLDLNAQIINPGINEIQYENS